MSKKHFTTLLIFLSAFPLFEIWHLWEGNQTPVDAFVFVDFELPAEWFYKFLFEKMALMSIAIVVYRLSWLSQELKVCSIVFLAYLGADFLLFFLCFNTWNLTFIYASLLFVAGIIWYGFKYANIRIVMNYECIYSGEVISPQDHKRLSYYNRFKYSTTFKKATKRIIQEAYTINFRKPESRIFNPATLS